MVQSSPDVRRTAFLRISIGAHDPTTKVRADGLWRATQTLAGPAVMRMPFSGLRSEARAWGPGSDLLLESMPSLLGEHDECLRVDSEHRAIREGCRRHWAVPLVRSDDPYHELLPAVLGQRITAAEASRQWAGLCRDLGGRAPGPDADMLLPPDPHRLASSAYHDLHEYGIERRRAETLMALARRADALVLGALGRDSGYSPSATVNLTLLRGVGEWTAAIAGGAAFGDPDAVPVGDFHLKNTVAFALAGSPRGTDEEMLMLLEPHRGQRARVLWWLSLDGWQAPRRGPRRRNLSVANL